MLAFSEHIEDNSMTCPKKGRTIPMAIDVRIQVLKMINPIVG